MSIPTACPKTMPQNNANPLESQGQTAALGVKSPTIRREEPKLLNHLSRWHCELVPSKASTPPQSGAALSLALLKRRDHQGTHFIGKASELPSPLVVGGLASRLHRLCSIDHWSQTVIGEVGRCNGMARRSCDRYGRLVSRFPCCGVCCDRRSLRDAGLDLASNPRPSDLDSLLRPIIGAMKLIDWQQMFCTIRGPCRKEPMIYKYQWPAAMGRDESLVTHGMTSAHQISVYSNPQLRSYRKRFAARAIKPSEVHSPGM
ncbi:hypothetical protein BH11PLA2_BH11PLA2_52550 [soil metagenome]